MKKIGSLLLFALVLTSCASPGQPKPNPGVSVRETYQTKPVNADIQLRTDFGDRVLDFSLRYTDVPPVSAAPDVSPAPCGAIEVVAPESIKGIKAELQSGSVVLSYGETTAELGALPGTGLSPLETVPLMVADWRGGHVTSVHTEEKNSVSCFCIAYKSGSATESIDHLAWFDKTSLQPVAGAIYIGGQLVVEATWQWTGES